MSDHSLNSALTIRRLDLSEEDRTALAELVARDSGEPLEAPVIGIEVEGQLLAAASLSSGEVAADPFSRTDELRALLALRAGQLARREAASPRGLRLLRRRPRLALAGGPPGSISTIPR